MKIQFLIFLILIASTPLIHATDKSNREIRTEAYFNEFGGNQFNESYPKIHQALLDVFHKLPDKVFDTITASSYPIIFVPTITSGIARYANAHEYINTKNDPWTLNEGFYLILLGDELNKASDVEAIEGVIFHEIAHRYLNHLRKDALSCELEREANELVDQWGFNQQLDKAQQEFGSKVQGDSPCRDLETQS